VHTAPVEAVKPQAGVEGKPPAAKPTP
jgi:hypothetical protein